MASRILRHLGERSEPSKQDLQYLAELYQEFRAPDAPEVHRAVQLLHERYSLIRETMLDQLGRLEEESGNSKDDNDRDEKGDSDRKEDVDEEMDLESYIDWCVDWVKEIHGMLYAGILKNAGHFRSKNDQGYGHIWFGSDVPRKGGHGKFRGSSPERIESDLRRAFGYLIPYDEPIEALLAVCIFYQQFVLCHPYYDANGRIGRLIATFYLARYGVTIRWEDMESSNNKFLNYLNKAHMRYRVEFRSDDEKEDYQRYIWYLARHVFKYTSLIE